jgi:hypothetical protein
MGNGSGASRVDRNRNARLERLRALVPVTNAIAGIDLAGSKQMVVVTDHDPKVIARRTFGCRAWDLGSALDWAAGRAAAHGWGGVTVSCEPTGHRWRVLGQLPADRGMAFVCVQPLVTSWSRRTDRRVRRPGCGPPPAEHHRNQHQEDHPDPAHPAVSHHRNQRPADHPRSRPHRRRPQHHPATRTRSLKRMTRLRSDGKRSSAAGGRRARSSAVATHLGGVRGDLDN